MPDILATGGSALLAFQRTLATISHNVANSATPGYSRQRVQYTPQLGQHFSFGYIGAGVQIQSVERITNRFLNNRIIDSAATVASLGPQASMGARLDKLLSDASTGLSSPLNKLFAGFEGVSAEPTSTAARGQLIANAQSMISRVQGLNTQLHEMGVEVNGKLRQSADQANNYIREIQQLNNKIVQARALAVGNAPNDLLDQRDRVVTQLSQLVGVTTTEQDDGSLAVFTQSGQPLVVSASISKLSVTADDYDPNRLSVSLTNSAGTIELPGTSLNGEIGGLIALRKNTIEPTAARMGRMVVNLARAINAQHREGMDIHGALGGDFFSEPPPVVRASSKNTGVASLTATNVNPSALTGEDYIFRLNGGSWEVLSSTSGSAVPFTGTGTIGDPFVVSGVEVVLAGAANNGDSFLVRPTTEAPTSFSLLVTDPNRIAAADALRSAATLSNLGDASIGSVTVTDVANPALLTPVTIQFTDPNNYTVNGSGPFAFTAGTPITGNGWQVTIEGSAIAGDSFTVSPRSANSSDNGNARLLAANGRANLVEGTRTLAAEVGSFTAAVGANAAHAQASLNAESVLDNQLRYERESVSGVNLDEEAANMIRFQQAYQAAAQIMAVADTLFQSLLNAVRR